MANINKNSADMPKSYTVLDLETTGLSPSRDSIIEVSALKVREDKVINEFSSLVNPGRSVSSFISRLTGITDEMLENAPFIIDVMPKFIEFTEDDVLLGHNLYFDLGFIRNTMLRHFQIEFKKDFIDTMLIAKKHLPNKSHKLKNLAILYNISTEGHHRALNDCYITHKVYLALKKDICNKEQIILS